MTLILMEIYVDTTLSLNFVMLNFNSGENLKKKYLLAIDSPFLNHFIFYTFPSRQRINKNNLRPCTIFFLVRPKGLQSTKKKEGHMPILPVHSFAKVGGLLQKNKGDGRGIHVAPCTLRA